MFTQARFDIDKVVAIDTPYGGNISEAEGPVFAELRLGDVGEPANVTYELIPGSVVAYAVGLNAIHGLSPRAAIHHARTSCEPIALGGLAIAPIYSNLLVALDYGCIDQSPGEDDRIDAIVDRHTKRVLFYHFYVQGDGFSALFTLK